MNYISEKTREIILKQTPVDPETFHRVKEALSKKGVTIAQSAELDEWLISKGAEALTFSDGTMVMHTRISASGFFEELIHYGQILKGQAIEGSHTNNLELEIIAKERIIKNRKVYNVTDYELGIITDTLNAYKKQLNDLIKGG